MRRGEGSEDREVMLILLRWNVSLVIHPSTVCFARNIGSPKISYHLSLLFLSSPLFSLSASPYIFDFEGIYANHRGVVTAAMQSYRILPSSPPFLLSVIHS